MTGATLIIHLIGLALIVGCFIPIIRSEWKREGVFRWPKDD